MYNTLKGSDSMTFGDRLLNLLDEKDISQKDFAAMLNIAPSTLNGYIKNKRQPDFELVKNMVFILGTSADYLLDCSGDNARLSMREMSLIGKMRILSGEQQEIIYDLVNISVKKIRGKQ